MGFISWELEGTDLGGYLAMSIREREASRSSQVSPGGTRWDGITHGDNYRGRTR